MGVLRKSWVEKLEEFKSVFEKEFGSEVGLRNLRERMSTIAHYHYNRKKSMLLGIDKKIYSFMMEQGYNPYTVYRWLLLEQVPDDIRFMLKERQISQKRAFSLGLERKRETDSSLAVNIRQLGLRLVRCM